MLEIGLKIVGGLVGMVAAWYISKKIAGWVSELERKWAAFKEEKIRQKIAEQKKDFEEHNKTNRKKIDDFFGGGEA